MILANTLKKHTITTPTTFFNHSIIKKHKKLKTSIITRITKKLNNTNKKTRLLRNNFRGSYGSRFLRTKKRILYYKTIKQQNRIFSENLETVYFSYLEKNIKKIEYRENKRRALIGRVSRVIPMEYRIFDLTTIYITHKTRNTFVTVFRGKKISNTNRFSQKSITKTSCGCVGYTGPKKSTIFARREVIKEIGSFIGGFMTTLLKVVFTTKVLRWNRKTIRNLNPNLSYVTTILIKYMRCHGKKKYKNERRK